MPLRPAPAPPRRLRNQVALVTGASRGIGLAIARALAAEHCNLILTGRDQSALNKVSRELASAKIKILAHSCDLRDPHSVDHLFRAIRGEFKHLDILINNAGIAHANLTVDNLPLPLWQDVIDTNLTGTFLVTQAALPIMKRGSTIVNNLSIAASRVFTGSAAYIARNMAHSASPTPSAKNCARKEFASLPSCLEPPTPPSGTPFGPKPRAKR